ncbi:2Fe-2S iron-sulfur cluster-binding protein [Mycobacterium aquaticum]|uniref:Ferredoxin n=1 Tax=Mycobacterium aquaticum TaxID=1927124 RepID=A0A1X0A8B0_9MYCO|nr:2Fe-2S iron-sulfur cluster-binding protein [Mycobacterium aquaticum]ORA26279.1 ferredoxin [Mycobacterium aquaticum]
MRDDTAEVGHGTANVTDREGNVHSVAFTEGHSLMESIRDAGIPDILALCGGVNSCATCHVIVDEDWQDAVGPATGDESDLLETSSLVTPRSRLSCQVALTARLDGLSVTIAPED